MKPLIEKGVIRNNKQYIWSCFRVHLETFRVFFRVKSLKFKAKTQQKALKKVHNNEKKVLFFKKNTPMQKIS